MTTLETSTFDLTAERAVKRERVLELLEGSDSAVWLSSPAAVSWYLGGARVHTSLVGPPIAGVLVGRETEQVVTFSNEADRLATEELPDDVEIRTVPWHTPLDSAVASLPAVRREAELDAELRAARASVLPRELSRFERLCRESAEILTAQLSAVTPETTERELSALVAAEILRIGADPVVVMVAGASRLGYKHPLVTDAPVGERAMVVVCARRHGMIANLSRWVRFGKAPASEAEGEHRLLQVEAAYLSATRTGRVLGDVLADGAAAYAAQGFPADEWQNHHQGGAAGYAGRDPRAVPGISDLVQDRQLFAWNPSAAGQKVEDTVILEGDQIRPLTVDPDWPTVSVNGIERPVTLQR
ncbi:M24 family metallopeptidase [Nesterenkonia flava]|uniref:Peptidase M24 n=1 Tax=Nesterenkonia flava TaxID=469799 RepID=A0ABU1FSW1_9MICC|nr:peptidase M24 [Nesterenkonia flava]MDR5711747.1 peptidase M24 [Nesterenkonia flava]